MVLAKGRYSHHHSHHHLPSAVILLHGSSCKGTQADVLGRPSRLLGCTGQEWAPFWCRSQG